MSKNQNQDNLVDISSIVNSDFKSLKKPELISIIERLITTVTKQGFLIKDLTDRDVSQKLELKNLNRIILDAPQASQSNMSNLMIISDGESIALKQLNHLKSKIENRDMTLEEARIYDILVKNLRLAREDKPVKEDYPSLKNADETKLLSLAKKQIQE